MPRDIAKELTELRQGLHQFTMSMYTILDKIVDEKEAKRKLIGVLQEEIKYIQSTTGEGSGELQSMIDELKAYQQQLAARIKNETDEGKRFEAIEAFQGLNAFIKYIE